MKISLLALLVVFLSFFGFTAPAKAQAHVAQPTIVIEQAYVQPINATNALVTFRVRVVDAAGRPVTGRVELRGRLQGTTVARMFFASAQLDATGHAYLQHHFIPGATPRAWDYRVVYPRHQGHGFGRAFVARVLSR